MRKVIIPVHADNEPVKIPGIGAERGAIIRTYYIKKRWWNPSRTHVSVDKNGLAYNTFLTDQIPAGRMLVYSADEVPLIEDVYYFIRHRNRKPVSWYDLIQEHRKKNKKSY